MGVVNKFVIASLAMFAAPIAILWYAGLWGCAIWRRSKMRCKILKLYFQARRGCDSTELSQESMTLFSGILAVFSVNVVIAFYIYMAMKEPSGKPEPDVKFLAQAKASIKQPRPSEVSDRSKHE